MGQEAVGQNALSMLLPATFCHIMPDSATICQILQHSATFCRILPYASTALTPVLPPIHCQVSSALVGAVLGTAAVGPISDAFGRRLALLGAAAIFTAGALSPSLPPSLHAPS